jgi:hypothetical protein
LPVFERSRWQIRIAEGGASFSDDGRWLPGTGGPELNFDVRLKEKKYISNDAKVPVLLLVIIKIEFG